MQILVQGLALFLNREPLFFLWSTLVNPNLTGTETMIQPTVISCIINIVFLSSSGHPGPARRNPTNIVSAACGKFHAVILQEASDHVPHISEQFLVCTGNTDLAISLNKDTFEPDPKVLTYKVDSTSKGTWDMVSLIDRGLLRRPPLSGSPTVTFRSVHIHNVVAKKRDASTELLQRLLWIYEGAQMSTSLVVTLTGVPFLRLVTCFRTQNFQILAIHSCGDWVHWRSRIVSALVSHHAKASL